MRRSSAMLFLGSRTPHANTITANTAGNTATQNTARKSFCQSNIKPTAIKGPVNAPTVSKDWRKPKAAPRTSGSVMSATKASRGAPRMPLPTRSINRPATIQPIVGAIANNGLLKAPNEYPNNAKPFRRPTASLMTPENTLMINANDSANPSSRPTKATLMPKLPTMNTGNRL